jgi:putative IMPACT (imprinted ancient) family translation regulator
MIDGRYPIPSGDHRVEQTIERSRFIATVGGAETVDSAAAFVETDT